MVNEMRLSIKKKKKNELVQSVGGG